MTKKDNNASYPACADCAWLNIKAMKISWRKVMLIYECSAQGYRYTEMVYGNNHCIKVFKPDNESQIKE